MARFTTQQRDEARSFLKKALQSNRTVYTLVRHVSSSGMTRHISSFITMKDKQTGRPRIQCIDFWMARALDYAQNRKNCALVVGGCGMDMGFHIVYGLGRVLWPQGDGKTVIGRNGDTKPETDGGYLLKQEWL